MTAHASLVIDIAGTELTRTDRRSLKHPLVGGRPHRGSRVLARLRLAGVRRQEAGARSRPVAPGRTCACCTATGRPASSGSASYTVTWAESWMRTAGLIGMISSENSRLSCTGISVRTSPSAGMDSIS